MTKTLLANRIRDVTYDGVCLKAIGQVEIFTTLLLPLLIISLAWNQFDLDNAKQKSRPETYITLFLNLPFFGRDRQSSR